MNEKIGFVGLGNLGTPVATNLLAAGYDVTVFNRTANKADALVEMGAKLANSAANTITSGGVVVTLLWNDAASTWSLISD